MPPTLGKKAKKQPAPRGRTSWNVSTLVRRALSARNDHTYWENIKVLHRRGTREVLDAATLLCSAKSLKKRRVGADILGQIGWPRNFPEQVLKVLHGLLQTETSADVLHSALVAIGHTQDHEDMRGIRQILSLQHHRNPSVRFAVVFALLGRQDRYSLSALIKLSEDPDDEVRDWATFGLGTQSDVDTLAIRKALWKRVCDKDSETRYEAMVGLAKRKDQRLRNLLIKELSRNNPGSLLFKAAGEYGDKCLLPLLQKQLRMAKKENGINKEWLKDLKAAIADLRKRSQ